MAVLLNVMFTCVGIQCYDKYVCVCVESELLDVFSSSLLVLLFAANMATVPLSLKSPLKAQPLLQPPLPPLPLKFSQEVRATSLSLRVGNVLAYCSPVSLSAGSLQSILQLRKFVNVLGAL